MDPRYSGNAYGYGSSGNQGAPPSSSSSLPFMSVGMGVDGKPLQPQYQMNLGYGSSNNPLGGLPSSYLPGYSLPGAAPNTGISLSTGLPYSTSGTQLGGFGLQNRPAQQAAFPQVQPAAAVSSSGLDLTKRDSRGSNAPAPAPAPIQSPSPVQTPAAPSGTANLQGLLNQLAKNKTAVAAKQKGVDLAFVIDCTYSMGTWIKEVKRKIKEIVQKTQEIEAGIRVRVAFVGYRDYTKDWPNDKNNGLVFLDFTENLREFRSFVKTVKEDAGHDYPEDVAGGFARVLKLSWSFNTRVLIHIGDAPPHGDKYNTGEWVDNFPKGDPAGGDCEDMLLQMAEQRIDYYFAKVADDTRLMEESFKKTLRTVSKTWAPLDLKAGSEQFLPKVVASVNASVRSGMGGPSIPRNY